MNKSFQNTPQAFSATRPALHKKPNQRLPAFGVRRESVTIFSAPSLHVGSAAAPTLIRWGRRLLHDLFKLRHYQKLRPLFSSPLKKITTLLAVLIHLFYNASLDSHRVRVPMLLKQPKLLYLLFFTELWERFGFYTVQTILILYLTHALGFSDSMAYVFTGAFGAFLYITLVPGGALADKFLGFQRAILIGGSLLALGYLTLAMPSKFFFYAGLSLLIIGMGFFKPNISSIVGTLYGANDPRRDSGFTLFYLGINLGSLIPPLFLGPLTKAYGWDAGFLVAMCGMLISLISFAIGRRFLKNRGAIPANSALLKKSVLRHRFNLYLVGGIILSALIFFIALHAPLYSNLLLIIICLVVIVYLISVVLPLPMQERNSMLACIILIVVSIGFWAIYNQTFGSLMLYADRNMSPDFLGMKIGAEFTQSFNPFFIIVFAPLFSLLWPALGKYNPSYPVKFAMAAFLIALGMFTLAFGTEYFNHNGLTSPWWLVLSYALQTTGELCLSPIGLAMITALAPQRYVGMMMGVWFLALSAGYSFSGGLGILATVPKNADLLTSQAIYIHAFNSYGTLGVVLGVIGLLLVPKLRKMCRAV